MELNTSFNVLLSSLVNAIPGLVVWIVALVSSIILLLRFSGRLERFLIAGSCLMLASTLLRIPVPAVAHYLTEDSLSNVSGAAIISGINLFLGLISLAGVICLFYAIWKKFSETAKVITKY
jgi:hypothetical protein